MKSFEKRSFGFKNPEQEAESYISYLEKPAMNLLELLREKVDNKEYDSILGDDADARIHALLLGNAIKEIYGDQKKIEIVFVQGGVLLGNPKLEGFPEHTAEVEAYLKRMRGRLGKKTLIVTEEILAGNSVNKLALILKSLGIEADIATFKVSEPEWFEGNPFHSPDGFDIYTGEGLASYMPKEYLGVWNRMRSGQGHAIKKYPADEMEQRSINAAREAAKSLSHKLAVEYSGTDPDRDTSNHPLE